MPATGPFQRLPPLVVVLVAVVLGVEAVFQLGARGMAGGADAVGWRMDAIIAFGFHDPLFDYLATAHRVTGDGAMRLFSYAFVHAGAAHAIFGAVLLLALGKAVSDAFGTPAMAGILAAGTAGGALAYGLLQDGRMPLIGVYPGVYGLIGAFSWALYMKADDGRTRLLAFRLVGLLVTLQLVFRLLFGGGNDWVADLGGFAAGFALSYVLAPDGGARLRRWRDRARGR